MTAIYVDPSALLLPTAEPGTPDEQVEPGGAEAVRHLLDAGYEVVLLAPEGDPVPGLPGDVRRASELPEHLDPDCWYLTGEPHPSFGRPRGGTTVLVATHDRELIRLVGRRTILLEHGRVAELS